MAREENRDGSIKNFAKSLKLSISNKTVLWLITFSILIGIPMYAFAVMMSQPYLVSRGFNIATIGVIFAVIRGMSGFLGSLSHRVEAKLGEKNSFFAIVILFVVLLVSAGLLKAKWVFIIIIALYTLEKYKSVVIDNYMNKHIDSASRATMLSIQSFLNNIVVTAIIVFIGHMIDLYSIDVVLIALGVMVGLLSIPFLFLRFIRVPDDKVVERI